MTADLASGRSVIAIRWCTEDDPCPDCAAGRDFDDCWPRTQWAEHPYDRPGPPFRFTPLRTANAREDRNPQ